MTRKRILFQGSHNPLRLRTLRPDQLETAQRVSRALGDSLIRAGFDIVLNSGRSMDACVGKAATAACEELGEDPRLRIRTYPYGDQRGPYFGMVLRPLDKRWQDVRTFMVREADAVVGVLGGKGTCDAIQKAVLAGKLVFPIAIAGGGSQEEWERLQRERYHHRTPGDLDFLADLSLDPELLAQRVAAECSRLLSDPQPIYSKRVFIVHGHDGELRSELARLLERLGLIPVILQEQPDTGRPLFSKLQDELADVGFGFVLFTPDDRGAPAAEEPLRRRARQNVVFEHGLLIGRLGPSRVCAVVKDDVELPSDINAFLHKRIAPGHGLATIALDLVRELRAAGYPVDANMA